MKAAVYSQFGSPDVLTIADVPKPIPGEHEILIRIGASTVTTTDCTARKGRPLYSRAAFGFTRPKHSILGTEFAGTVEAIGSRVSRFSIGDEVVAASGISFGGHAEYICLPEDGAIAGMPNGATFEEAAALCEGGLTALPFLRDVGDVRAGSRILINGASGAVGSASVQLAKTLGVHVTGVCGPTNVDLVKALGADAVIDYSESEFSEIGEQYDVVFDAVGKSSFRKAARAIVPGGIYMTTVPSFSIIPQALWTTRFGERKARISFTGLRKPGEKSQDLETLGGFFESGQLKPLIEKTLPLESIAEAHEHIELGHKRGHIVLVFE